MVKLNYDQKLKDMGWKLLLQIHDEVIMVRVFEEYWCDYFL